MSKENIVEYCFDDLRVGMSAYSEIKITAMRVSFFAAVSGDTQPLHLDEAYAKKTIFKGRIAHGMLVASLISAVIGTKLPGSGTVLARMPALLFKRPVRIGDVVRTEIVITTLVHIPKRRVRLRATCTVNGKVVIEPEEEIEVTVPRYLRA